MALSHHTVVSVLLQIFLPLKVVWNGLRSNPRRWKFRFKTFCGNLPPHAQAGMQHLHTLTQLLQHLGTIKHTKYAAVDMRVCACVYTRFTTYLAWNAYHGLAFKPNFLPNLPTFLSHLHKHLWSGNTSSCQQDMASTLPLPNCPEVFGKVTVPPLLSIYKLPVLHTRCNEPKLLLQASQQVWAVVCGFGGKKNSEGCCKISVFRSSSSNSSCAVACCCAVVCQLHLLPLVQATFPVQ